MSYLPACNNHHTQRAEVHQDMLLHFSVVSTTTASSLVKNDHEAGSHAQAAMAVVSARRFRYHSDARLWLLRWFWRTVRPFLQKWGREGEVFNGVEGAFIHGGWRCAVYCCFVCHNGIMLLVYVTFLRFSAYTSWRSGEAHAPCLSSEDSFTADSNVFGSSYTFSQSWIKCLPSHDSTNVSFRS